MNFLEGRMRRWIGNRAVHRVHIGQALALGRTDGPARALRQITSRFEQRVPRCASNPSEW